MNRKLLQCVAGLSLAGALPAAADCVIPGPGVDQEIDNRAVVRVAPYADVSQVVALLEQLEPGLEVLVLGEIAGRDIFLLELVPPAGTTDCQINDAYFEPGVPLSLVNPDPTVPNPAQPLVWGELEYEAEAAEGKTGSGYVSRPQMTAANFASQYLVSQLGLAQAAPLASGAGTVVAVLDTGVDAAHPALAGRIAPGGYNFVLNSASTADAGDGQDSDGDAAVDEMVGHGTYVAGLIALVAPETRILPIVVLDSDGVGGAFQIAQGVYHAIDRGVEVINLSLGSTYQPDILEQAINDARAHGITVVAAAGNFDREDPEEFPAQMDCVLGVAALDDSGVKAPFSNYDEDLFIAAPGTSALLGQEFDPARTIYGPVPGTGYAAWEGTSVATALVSGAAALVRSQNPQWPASPAGASQLAAVLASSAVNIYPQNPQYEDDHELGAGGLDVAAAVALSLPAPARGDLNNDGLVDLNDLLILLADYNAVHSSADLDTDGRVELDDLLILLTALGQARP